MGWDPIAKTVIGSDDAWAIAIAVSAKHNLNKINYQSFVLVFIKISRLTPYIRLLIGQPSMQRVPQKGIATL